VEIGEGVEDGEGFTNFHGLLMNIDLDIDIDVDVDKSTNHMYDIVFGALMSIEKSLDW